MNGERRIIENKPEDQLQDEVFENSWKNCSLLRSGKTLSFRHGQIGVKQPRYISTLLDLSRKNHNEKWNSI